MKNKKHLSVRSWILIAVLILCILCFVAVPLAINWQFQTDAPCSWLVARWSAGDALAYFGSVFSGAGTILLGMVTIYQTDRIHKLEAESDDANIKRPFFIIEKVSSSKNGGEPFDFERNGFVGIFEHKKIYVFIKNVGDGVANKLSIEGWGCGEIPEDFHPFYYASPNSLVCIPICKNEEFGSKQLVNISYENLIGFKYSQTIEYRIDYDEYAEKSGDIDELDTGERILVTNDQLRITVCNISYQTEIGESGVHPRSSRAPRQVP